MQLKIKKNAIIIIFVIMLLVSSSIWIKSKNKILIAAHNEQVKNTELPNYQEKNIPIQQDKKSDIENETDKRSMESEYQPSWYDNSCDINLDGPGLPDFNSGVLEKFTSKEYVNKQYNFKVLLPRIVKSYYVFNFSKQIEQSDLTRVYFPVNTFYFSRKKNNFKWGDHVLASDLFQVTIFKIDECNKNTLNEEEKDFCNTFVFSKQTNGTRETRGLSYDKYFGDPVSAWVRNDKYLIFIKKPLCKQIEDETILNLYNANLW